jgi:predicted nucleic acid-binding protein
MTSSDKEPVLDTMVLQAFGFGHPGGIELLLRVLQAETGRFPAEVYAADEEELPLREDDEDLSELARGLRYAKRQVQTLPPSEGERYQRWLDHASQIKEYMDTGDLVLDSVRVEELPKREELMAEHGIGRGEAACLVLALRYGAPAVFVSSDEEACEVADELGIQRITIRDVLRRWVNVLQPPTDKFDGLIEGLRQARFDPGEDFVESLRKQL